MWLDWCVPIACSESYSDVEDGPAEVVAPPLVVEHELANLGWELVALPPALEPPPGLTPAVRSSSTHGFDRIGSGPELVRGDVGDDRGLASSVCRIPGSPSLSL
jgi:hypothetical protein